MCLYGSVVGSVFLTYYRAFFPVLLQSISAVTELLFAQRKVVPLFMCLRILHLIIWTEPMVCPIVPLRFLADNLRGLAALGVGILFGAVCLDVEAVIDLQHPPSFLLKHPKHCISTDARFMEEHHRAELPHVLLDVG